LTPLLRWRQASREQSEETVKIGEEVQAEAGQADGKQEPQAPKWGDPISEERQDKLQQLLDVWNAPDAEHGIRRGPFYRVELSAADVFWLAKQVRDVYGYVPNLHLEGTDLGGAQLQGPPSAGLELTRLGGHR
jgi:hypothetical protein